MVSFSIAYCSETSPPLLLKAQEIFNAVHQGEAVSTYSHENKVLYHMNCYGFLNHLVQQTAPKAFQEMVEAMEKLKEVVPPSFDGMPCPYNYAAALKNKQLRHWEVIDTLEDIQPGDILIYLPVGFEPQDDFDVGQPVPAIHMMVVEAVLGKVKAKHHFRVIDCTRIPHNRKDDTRYPKKGGIGKSSVYLSKREENYGLQWTYTGRILAKEMVFARITQECDPF
ncbi:hypothetical protein [Simkania sp.]|uniref:hypothetical protein n=1 Tax=Simkania sp. TaxID=34094 RepID=UPI003B5202B1